jgi:hypothetical protein
MGQNDEHDQHSKRCGRNGEETDRGDLLGVIAKKGRPNLRQRARTSETVFAEGRARLGGGSRVADSIAAGQHDVAGNQACGRGFDGDASCGPGAL